MHSHHVSMQLHVPHWGILVQAVQFQVGLWDTIMTTRYDHMVAHLVVGWQDGWSVGMWLNGWQDAGFTVATSRGDAQSLSGQSSQGGQN